MQENKGFSLPSRIALGLLAVAILVYTVFHVMSLFQIGITTIAAGETTEYTTVSASGYVFRNETVLYSANRGAVDYAIGDGEKVKAGQELAYVYSGNGEESIRQTLRTLDQTIAVLEQSMESVTDDQALDQINDSYAALVKMLASGDLGGLSETTDALLVGMNQFSVLSGKGKDAVVQTLAALKEQRESILAGQTAERCVAQDSGYFYSYVDGYETAFTMAAAKRLTPDTFFSFFETLPPNEVPEGQMAYGKLTENSQWSFVIPMTAKEASYFEKGASYQVSFFQNADTVLPMTLESIVSPEATGTYLLRFSCDRMPTGFIFHRCEDVKITVNSISGMYVPKQAVERVNGAWGVYILRGSVVRFRHIEIVYEGTDYYLVKANASSEEEDVVYLRPNDLMIINGYQLFDGRILD